MTPHLYTANNPHAPLRANGRRFWGYPSRTGGLNAIRVIGLHTAEIAPSTSSAEAIGRYLRDQAARPASYHSVVDNDSEVILLPDEAVAFGIGNFNTPTLHLSFATKAADWGKNLKWDRDALEIGAVRAAIWAKKYNIPLKLITRAQANAGHRGFVRHSVMDPGRRRDPGDSFPVATFFHLIRRELAPKEPDMAKLSDEAQEFWEQTYRELASIPAAEGGPARPSTLKWLVLWLRDIRKVFGRP